MSYYIKTINSIEQIHLCNKFSVDNDNGWGYRYRPKTWGRMGYLENFGFVVEMVCEEKNPLARYTEFNDPVYTDSAMEAFIDFNPLCDSPKYINFEFNSNGAFLAKYRTDRSDAVSIDLLTNKMPTVKTNVQAESWTATLFIPLEMIKDIYKVDTFSKGCSLKGNFFKIGENQVNPHFLSFAKIESDKPDFHRPEFFKQFIID